MRSGADLLVCRSCNEDTLASLSGRHVSTSCESFSLVSPIDANCFSTSRSHGTCGTGCGSNHQTTTSGATDNSESASPRNSASYGNSLRQSSDPATEIVADVEEHPTVPDREQNRLKWKSILLCRRERNHGVF